MSVAFIISEIIHQMIFIYGTSFTVLMCKMAISLGLFYFFKILIFFVARRVKEQKIAQHDKKTLSHSVSEELQLIWLWLLVQIMSNNVFHFFKILIFQVLPSSLINAQTRSEVCPTFFTCV